MACTQKHKTGCVRMRKLALLHTYNIRCVQRNSMLYVKIPLSKQIWLILYLLVTVASSYLFSSLSDVVTHAQQLHLVQDKYNQDPLKV